MALRGIFLVLLLPAGAALAQPTDHDNDPPVLPDPPAVVRNAIPPSQVNAGTAIVSPAIGDAQARVKKTGCRVVDSCATPTPDSR
jgi:hypothetical protein